MTVSILNCAGGELSLPGGATSVELATVLAGNTDGPLVVYAPAPGWEGEHALAEALVNLQQVLVVRAEPWDGFTPDPLAAAAEGVIAGFGAAGVAAAVAELSGD